MTQPRWVNLTDESGKVIAVAPLDDEGRFTIALPFSDDQCPAVTTRFLVGHTLHCDLPSGHEGAHWCREYRADRTVLTDTSFVADAPPLVVPGPINGLNNISSGKRFSIRRGIARLARWFQR